MCTDAPRSLNSEKKMKLKILRADPAGNITMFVLTPVEKEKYSHIARSIMALHKDVEQVAFRTAESRIEMAGGEFCGNASRAFGMLLARERQMEGECSFDIQISGCAEPVTVRVNTHTSSAEAQMPLPLHVERRCVGDVQGTLVHLGGIAHFVVKNVSPSREFFDSAESVFRDFEALEAYGVIFLDEKQHAIAPLIKVPAAGTLVWEGSCGSGTLACAVAESIGLEGSFTEKYLQPAGEIVASVARCKGILTQASIGGLVSLGEYEEL